MEISNQPQNILLFGGDGQIGQALIRQFKLNPTDILELTELDWQAAPDSYLATVKKKTKRSPSQWTVVFANGLTDSTLPYDLLLRANLEFPQKALAALQGLGTVRALTLGTVFETFTQASAKNPYFKSKLELAHWIEAQSRTSQGKGRYLHLRLHTIYSEQPRPHMFLGLIEKSLRENTVFKMTSGQQLREYHHVDDVAHAIYGLIQRNWEGTSVLELNSGQPVQLAEIARSVFAAFGKTDLLKIGALPEPATENHDRLFTRSDEAVLPRFRNPIEGIISSMRAALRL